MGREREKEAGPGVGMAGPGPCDGHWLGAGPVWSWPNNSVCLMRSFHPGCLPQVSCKWEEKAFMSSWPDVTFKADLRFTSFQKAFSD